MDIDARAEILDGHAAALDVPARTSWTPWTGPRRLARLLRLPEHEIQGSFFARIVGEVATLVRRQEPGIVANVARRFGEPPEVLIGLDTIIDPAIAHVG